MRMKTDSKIYVAGHQGLVGSAIVRRLEEAGYHNLVLRTHKQLDLVRQEAVESFFAAEKPEYVFVAAGLVGGIRANSGSPADFFLANMSIANHILWSAYRTGVKKLLYLGSACMYPANCPQPMHEADLLSGPPEITNEGYALAKLSGCRLCSYFQKQYGVAFISTIPANAYGLNDCFDAEKSHVIPALLMKFHKAKTEGLPQVELWGSGRALREFLYTDDLADGCLFLMEHYNEPEPINMGSGEEVSMLQLAEMVGDVVGYEGKIVCDPSKPDGMARRMVENDRIGRLGWRAKTDLRSGLERVYRWFLDWEKGGKVGKP